MATAWPASRIAILIFGIAAGAVGAETPEDLSGYLAGKLEDSPLPALAAAVVVDGELRAQGAAGIRKRGDETAVTVEDKWHIGSCTKSMTATLAAALVEDGLIGWDSTVGEILGDLEMKEEYQPVTLRQLLSHSAGLPTRVPPATWMLAWRMKGEPRAQRRAFATLMLAHDPRYPPGEGYEYSNSGYTVAGVMLEEVADKPWEDLLRDRLFEPLDMKSAGFREPASEGEVDQPWGHQQNGKPVPPGPKADNPDAISPGGVVHCSIGDLARYARMHALREIGPVLKKPESFETLHTVVSEEGEYSLGWVVVERDWAKGLALTHGGSNTMFAAVVWLAPERDFAVVVASNIGMDVAGGPMDRVAGELIGKYLDRER